MLARELMTEGVLSVKSDATVLEAASLLVTVRAGAMPVLDEQGVMLGIVTEADLLPYAALDKAATNGADHAAVTVELLKSRRVTEVMTRDVVTIEDTATLNEVVALMTEKRLKHLPVRRGKAIVGLVSRIDLLRVIAAEADGPAIQPLGAEDKGLRARVLASLQGKAWSNAMGLDVAVDKGDVHLWGTVGREEEEVSYRRAAESVPGVKRVISHMHVSVMARPPAGL